MAQEYTIQRVSEREPRAWNFEKDGNTVFMETYKVMLQGIEGPIDVNKKAGNAPKVGDVLYGSITQDEYGQKFKAAKKPFTPGQAAPRDQSIIKAQWAIGQAVALGHKELKDIELAASALFLMADRVKEAKPTEKSGYDQFKETGEKLAAKQSSPTSGTDVFDLDKAMDEPINLDEIPF